MRTKICLLLCLIFIRLAAAEESTGFKAYLKTETMELTPGAEALPCEIVVENWGTASSNPLEIKLPVNKETEVLEANPQILVFGTMSVDPGRLEKRFLETGKRKYVLGLFWRAKADAVPGETKVPIVVRQEGIGEVTLSLTIFVKSKNNVAETESVNSNNYNVNNDVTDNTVYTGGREINSRTIKGSWESNAGSGTTIGTIPNDSGFSFFILPQTFIKSSITVTARVRFRSHIDYSGAGIALIDTKATGNRMPHLRLEISERQDSFWVGGWIEPNENYYESGTAKSPTQDIKLGEWYNLKLQVEGTMVYGFLDDTELFANDIAALNSLPEELSIAFFIIEADAEFSDLTVAGVESTTVTDEHCAQTPIGNQGINNTEPLEQQQTIGVDGGSITLQDGAKFIAPGGLFETPTSCNVSLKRAEAPQDMIVLSDAYYLSSDKGSRAVKEYTLEIPYNTKRLPANTPENNITAYEVDNGRIATEVPCRIDTVKKIVSITNPCVNITGPDCKIRFSKWGENEINDTRNFSYVVAPCGLKLENGDISNHETVHKAGAIHEMPGHVFSIRYDVSASCELAQFTSNALQDAYNLYREKYKHSNNTMPFEKNIILKPYSRMKVYLQDWTNAWIESPTNLGSYKPWGWGIEFMEINVPQANLNRTKYRDTLFHEFFHALEDDFCNMTSGNKTLKWWLEATAEWAGYHYGNNQTFAQAAPECLKNFSSFLSLPIQESDIDELYYGYSLLIDYIVSREPQYVARTLANWNNADLYRELVEAGYLKFTYPQFLSNVLTATLAAPRVIEPWTEYRIVCLDDKTIINKAPKFGLEPDSYKVEQVRPYELQSVVLPVNVGPLTTKFVNIRDGIYAGDKGCSKPTRLTEQCKLHLKLTYKNLTRTNALIITRTQTSSSAVQPMDNGEFKTSNLGKSFRDIWIAVYNSSPDEAIDYSLTIEREQTIDKNWLPGNWVETSQSTGDKQTIALSREGATVKAIIKEKTYFGNDEDGKIKLSFQYTDQAQLKIKEGPELPIEVRQQIVDKGPTNTYDMLVISPTKMTGEKQDSWFFDWDTNTKNLHTLEADPKEKIIWERLS